MSAIQRTAARARRTGAVNSPDRAEMLLAEAPPRLRAVAAAENLIAEEDQPWHQQADPPEEPSPTPAEQLAAALRDLDLDAITPRQALTWLWEQQERLPAETSEP